jgi:hypothetical protein
MKPTRKSKSPSPCSPSTVASAHDPCPPSRSAPNPPAGIRDPHSFRLPPEFQGLSPEQLDYINNQLRSHTYAEVQELLFTDMGLRISINKLFRYFQKVELADQLEIAEDSVEAVEQLLKIYNSQPVDIDKAGLETIKRRALQLAVSPSTKPSLLLSLMRIFTWEHRKSMDEHRKQMDREKSAHRNRIAAVAEGRAKCEEIRVETLQRRQTHLEKTKSASTDFAQAQITELLRKELSQPWPASAGTPAADEPRNTSSEPHACPKPQTNPDSRV